MQITLTNRFSLAPIHSGEFDSVRAAVLDAVAKKISLASADLSGANLRSANLRGADLRGADLYGADLSGADLSGANLRGADLGGANLSGADLSGANLSGADLYGADLRSADLGGANLSGIKTDFFKVLAAAPKEVLGLLATLRKGKVDGSTYTGTCACLVGTLANVRQCHYGDIPGLTPDGDRPAEKWFLAIRAGDKPETNQVAKITEGWILEWLAEKQPSAAPVLAVDAAAAAQLAHFTLRRHEMMAAGDVEGLQALVGLIERRDAATA